ncbi:cbb3-type cytochrome oxidase subunit 3 [Pseudorhodoferax sp.]|jgi:cbb3-type cytochrome oxidase subunit 3|uniref:cbb3-type cytochrome oxidase subunit 3 n=1 Tax=Pseudorhodoferax sp. TaxID=1993553 RepID=UPI002DD65D52|nr:CcoQ/FixQ family Cbb3-type cytochrome c oxidase assembly chaperone [Pseudorhodoferax sp.]
MSEAIDLNTLRSVATVLGFFAFVLLVWRVWRREAQPQHDSAAALPFLQDDQGVSRE